MSPIATLVRRHDPDRFFTALFAPADKRETLLILYAFNHELARAREVVSQPALALMRLQWWREVVEGARRAHEVAGPLGEALERGELDRGDLLGVIEAREVEAEPAIETLAAWREYLLGSAGGLAVAAGRLLGATNPDALRLPGAAYGAAGILRSVAALARQGRCLLPADVLTTNGVLPEAVVAAPDSAPVIAAIRQLVAIGREMFARSPGLHLQRDARAAALPAVFAARDLKRGPPFRIERGLGDRLAVLRAALTGIF